MEYLPDTSAIIEGVLSEWTKEGKISGKIYLHRAVISELNNQANRGKIKGFLGLEEIRKLRDLEKEGKIEIEIVGDYPDSSKIKRAKRGSIDLMIIEYAYENGITLITADRVQAETARAMGIEVIYIRPKVFEKLEFERFFDEATMSVHLKEGCHPIAKKGYPGNWKFIKISDEILEREYLEKLALEILEFAAQDPESFVEIDRGTTTIVQIRNYRVVICKPPFSDGWEITIVRPIKRLEIQDYKLPEKLLRRLSEKAEGILIAGAPGAGKCVSEDTIIKTEKGDITAKELYDKLEKGEEIRILTIRMHKIEFNKIIRHYKRKARFLIKIITESGKEIKLTPNHPIILITESNVGWFNARNVKEGDLIATFGEDEWVPVEGFLKKYFNGKFIKKDEIYKLMEKIEGKESFENLMKLSLIGNKYFKWEKVSKVERIKGNFEVYDFECEKVHNFVANSFVVHNSTFAQALAKFYARKNKIVKTVESPRDLVLPPEITQYSKNYGSSEEIHDVLLLSRPDYTIFDEMRNDEDFRLYIDMRLAGVGMVGVIHAASPIDAIQRFIRRLELGQIPSVIDTVIFIKNGKVHKVYSLEMTVKVPSGMTDRDLARPVIEVRDFLTGELEYEIYKFGEETVVVPIKKVKARRIEKFFEAIGIEGWEEKEDCIIVYISRKRLKKAKGSKLRKMLRLLEKRIGKRVEIEIVD